MSVSAKRSAKIEITSSAAGIDPGLNDARRKMRGFQREQAKASKDAARAEAKAAKEAAKTRANANSFGGKVVSGMVVAAGFDLAGGFAGMGQELMNTQRELTRFQIDAQLSTSEAARFNDQLLKTSSATGQSRLALLEGAHAYQILTGDAKGAIETSQLFAEVANASGTSMQDIASAAASMKNNLGFDPKQLREGFDVILSMGHKGAVELRDVAGTLAGISPQFAQFGAGGGAKGLAELIASLQVVKFGFGSAEEAATGLQSLMTGIIKKRGKLERAGIQVIDPKTGKLNDFMKIMDQMKAKKFDLMSLMDDLGRIEGVKAATQLVGEKNAEMHDLYNSALGSNQVAKDNATYMESSTGRIARIWEQIKNSIAEAFSPDRIEAFATILEHTAGVWKGLENVGKKLRGWMSGPPVALSEADRAVLGAADYEAKGGKSKMMRHAAEAARGNQLGELDDPERWKGVVDSARKRAADVESAQAAISDIMGAESDEKTTKDSIRRAIFASSSEMPHTALVGQHYLKAAGIDDEEKDRLTGEMLRKAMQPMVDQLKAIAANTLAPPKVEINSNDVQQRTRPGGRR